MIKMLSAIAVSLLLAVVPVAFAQDLDNPCFSFQAPNINGTLEGSVQQMSGQGFSLNSSTVVLGDWLVPGTPNVNINGSPDFGGVLEGSGSTSPSGYWIHINSGSKLRNMITRTNPVALPVVNDPPAPTGYRWVSINTPSDEVGDWSTVRGLTLNSGAGSVEVPPGTYGQFRSNNSTPGTGFIFGIAGSEEPAVYNLESLTLNAASNLQVVGPVIIHLRDRVTVNGGTVMGNVDHPEWLTLRVARYNLTVNSGGFLHGQLLEAPNGNTYINGTASGRVFTKRLTINSGAKLTVLSPSEADPDADGDGLLDEWEQQIIDADTNDGITGIEDVFPEDDFDGDEVSNRLEFVYETDPTDPASYDIVPWAAEPLLHLRADEKVTEDGSGFVELWEDLSGNDNNAAQTVQSERPSYIVAVPQVANHAAVRFDGVDDFLNIGEGFSNFTEGLSVVVVFRPNEITGSEEIIDFTDATGIERVALGREGQDSQLALKTGDGPFAESLPGTLREQLFQLITVVHEGANAAVPGSTEFYRDAEPFGQAVVDVPENVQRVLNLLGGSNQPSDAFLSADVVELVVYPQSLEFSRRQALEQALMQKYNLPYTDNDGLDDDWEQQIIDADPDDDIVTIDDVLPEDDFDGDGLSNEDEFNDGTDPTDFFNGITPRILLVSGSGQLGLKQSYLPAPIRVQVTTPQFEPLPNAPITFSIVGGDGHLSPDQQQAVQTFDIHADGNGEAEVSWFLGNDQRHRAQATSGDGEPAVFLAESADSLTGSLTVVMPQHGQVVESGRPGIVAMYSGGAPVLPDSFRILLTDSNGVTRDFSADAIFEENKVGILPSFDIEDGDYTATFEWVINGNVIASDSASFTVAADIPGGGTEFRGTVLSITGNPLQNVEIFCDWPDGMSHGTTDANGQFTLTNLPAGLVMLRYEPTAAFDSTIGPGDTNEYVPVNLEFEVLDGRITEWARPIYLPVADYSQTIITRDGEIVDEVYSDSYYEQVITSSNPALAGVELVIPPFTTLSFPDGNSDGPVTILEIPVDRSPNCLGPGIRPSRLISIQPENTILSQPAKLVMPNDLQLPEGSEGELLSLNIVTGRFGPIGQMKIINGSWETLPGSGFTTFDWHAPSPGAPQISSGEGGIQSEEESGQTQPACSYFDLRTGDFQEDHFTPAYFSLGTPRSVGLHYSSKAVQQNPVFSALLSKSRFRAVPDRVEMGVSSSWGSGRTFYRTESMTGQTSYTHPAGCVIFLPEQVRTGYYDTEVRLTNYYEDPRGNPAAMFSQTVPFRTAILNRAQISPALPKGWSISNVETLLVKDNGHLTLVEPNGDMREFNMTAFRSNFGIANAGFELGELGDFQSSGNVAVIGDLGFVKPREGAFQAFLQADPYTAGEDTARLVIPFDSLPSTTTRIELEVNTLADYMLSGGRNPVTIKFRYGNNINFDTLAGWEGEVEAHISGFTAWPGADTPYPYMTGYSNAWLNLPDAATQKSGYLLIELDTEVDYYEFGYGSDIVTDNVRTAVLLDQISFSHGRNLIDPIDSGEDLFYANGEADDFSRMEYDGISRRFIRTFKDGSQQIFQHLYPLDRAVQVETRDRNLNTTTYSYVDANGDGIAAELHTITDPVGKVTTLTYNGGKLRIITDPAGRVTTLEYAGDQLVRIVNPDSTDRRFGYDERGYMTSQTDALGVSRFYEMTEAGRVKRVTRQDGSVYGYEPQQTRGLVDGEPKDYVGGSTTTTENWCGVFYPGQPVHIGGGSDVLRVDNITLDREGNRLQDVDALGQKSGTTWNSQNRPRIITQKNLNKVRMSWSNRGNLEEVSRDFDDAKVTIENKGDFEQPSKVIDTLDRETQFTYYPETNAPGQPNAYGNLQEVTLPLVAGETTPRKISYTYNERGQILTVTDALGDIATTAKYYPAGDPHEGMLWKTRDKLGRESILTYDSAGRVDTVEDPLGRKVKYTYDAMNRVEFVTANWQDPDPANHEITQYVYNANGDLTDLIDANGNSRSWTYDPRRRVKTMDYDGVTEFFYDEVSNITGVKRKDGTVVSYNYDVLNRLTRKILPTITTGIGSVPGESVFYGYDEVNNLTSVSDSDSSLTMVHDQLSRLTSTTQTWNGLPETISYTYDELDRRQTMTARHGTTQYLEYDEWDRLKELVDPANRAFTMEYDPLSRIERLVRPNDTETIYDYSDGAIDDSMYLTGILHRKISTGDVIDNIRYTHYADGSRATESRLADTLGNINTRTFTYDAAANRLLSVRNDLLPEMDEDFSYDKEGNWAAPHYADRVHNAQNELLEDTGYFYSYDPEGNMISQVSFTDPAGDFREFVYDAENRLVEVRTPDHVVEHKYDPLGRRVARTVTDLATSTETTTRYILDGWNVLLETDGNGNLLAANTHTGLDQLLVHDRTAAGVASPYHVYRDGLLSTVAIADGAGSVQERYSYSAYGQITVLGGNFTPKAAGTISTLAYTYTGREWDTESKLFNSRNRFYEPVNGRFLSRDPAGVAAGSNLYVYTLNNPTNGIDPFGLDVIYLLDQEAVPIGQYLDMTTRGDNARPGAGHGALLIGDDKQGYTYISYGPGPDGRNGAMPWAADKAMDNLDVLHFPNTTRDEMFKLLSQIENGNPGGFFHGGDYDHYLFYDSSDDQDREAYKAALDAVGSGYWITGWNCDDVCAEGLKAAGVNFDEAWRPVESYDNNKSNADCHGKIP